MSNRRRRARLLLAPALATGISAGLLGGGAAHSDLIGVDLLTGFDVRLDGAAGDYSGDEAAGVGDVNGDGLADVLIGAPGAGNNGRDRSGSAYVVFGGGTGAIDLADLGTRGLRIDGAAAGDAIGRAVSGAGDVNGDGNGDLLIGAPSVSNNSRGNSGSTYVVLGGSTAPVDLAALGTRGFRIDGAAAFDRSGAALSGAGDVNGDGYGDLLIGAPNANNGRNEAGSTYVVFGGSTAPVDLANLGSRGFRIDGAAGEGSGDSVAGVGDFDGDGFDDLLIGAPYARKDPASSGAAYLVLGANTTTSVDLANLGDRGLRIDGPATEYFSALTVASSGDVNGDGLGDLLIGVPHTNDNGRDYSGSAFVVFGGTTGPVNLAKLGSRGFRIEGAATEDRLGRAVSPAGDVNGDGRDDLLIGAPKANKNAGAAYVILGGSRKRLDLAEAGNRWFGIRGAAGDYSGAAVARAGDVNGDGLADLVIGAPNAERNGRNDSGSTYVVFGRQSATLMVRARKELLLKPTARTRLVRSITVGPGQKARVTVKVLPKNARKTVRVRKTRNRVVVRTRNTPRKTRTRIRITSGAPDHFTKTWVRTWRVR